EEIAEVQEGCWDYFDDSALAFVMPFPLAPPQDICCPADLDCNGIVNVNDFLLLLGAWGSCPAPCPADIDGNGTVNVVDFLALIGAWGPCPG
ncbi:MAG: hypothetical protein ACYSVY_25245, partial [Planctomycetota bacterium]